MRWRFAQGSVYRLAYTRSQDHDGCAAGGGRGIPASIRNRGHGSVCRDTAGDHRHDRSSADHRDNDAAAPGGLHHADGADRDRHAVRQRVGLQPASWVLRQAVITG